MTLEQVVAKTADKDLFNTVVKHLFTNVCRRMESYHSYSKRMTDGQKLVILMYVLCAEAANGGIHQFLSNSSGDLTNETIDALKKIDAEKQVTALATIAHEVFGGTIPKSRNKRNDLLTTFEGDERLLSEQEFEDSLDEADEFFRAADQHFGWCEEIKSLATKYIRQHPEEFKSAEQDSKPKWLRLFRQ